MKFLRSTIGVIVSLLLLSACTDDQNTTRTVAQAPVSVAAAETKKVERTLHVVGNVEASAVVDVKARVTGELQKVHIKEGEIVREGQALFTIDPRPFEASLREAEARLEKDMAQLRKAQEDMRRYGKLVGDGYVSREMYDQTSTDAAALRATVQADKAAMESARLQVEYCTVRAPISGRAGEMQADRGNMIKANADEPIVSIATLSPVHVAFAVPEVHLPAIQKRLRQGSVRIEATPTGGDAVAGTIDLVANTVDTRTGTIRVRGIFDNADQKLWPGQFVQVVLFLGEIDNAVVVPARAVQAGRNESYVYVVDAQSKAQYRKVQVVMEQEGIAVIGSGVTAGERVVTAGQVRLAPGVPVSVQ